MRPIAKSLSPRSGEAKIQGAVAAVTVASRGLPEDRRDVRERARVSRQVTPFRPASPEAGPWEEFLKRLRSVTVLDPACGSGNFLYIALHALKDLEREALHWGSEVLGVPIQLPQVTPAAVKGIELNHYAAELARVTIWIGEIQWMLQNGFAYLRDPILRPLDAIQSVDAVLDLSDPDDPREPDWPDAEFIVGNPPCELVECGSSSVKAEKRGVAPWPSGW